MSSTDHGIPHNAISNLPLSRPSYFRHHLILEHVQPMFLPLMWETKFHTQTKQQEKLKVCIFWCVYFSVARGRTDVSGANGSRHSASPICYLFLHTYKSESSLYWISQSQLQTLFCAAWVLCMLCLVLMSFERPNRLQLKKKNFKKSRVSPGPPLWSSGQSFWLQIQRSRVRFPALPDFSE